MLFIYYNTIIMEKLLEKCNFESKRQQTLILNVISIISKYDGKIFGGFIRDLLCGDRFNDIDIRFDNLRKYNLFKQNLHQFYAIDVIKTEKKYDFKCFSRIKIRDPLNFSAYVQIDVIFPSDTENINCRTIESDFDVNQLQLSNNKFDLCQTGKYLDYSKIIQNIKNKHFNVMHTCCLYRDTKYGNKMLKRIEKMEKKGWICINRYCCGNPMCWLAPHKIYLKHVKRVRKEMEEEKRRNEEEQFYIKLYNSYGTFDPDTIDEQKLYSTLKNEKRYKSKRISNMKMKKIKKYKMLKF